MQATSARKWEELERLGAAALREPDRAWCPFWAALHPELDSWVRRPSFLGRVGQDEDHCADIVMLAWEKLQERDFAKLRAYFDRANDPATGPSSFRAWMFRVFKNIGIDYMRALPEYIRRRGEQRPPATEHGSEIYWRSVCTLHSSAAAQADPQLAQATARRMLAFLDDSIPARMARAVELADGGASDASIGDALGLLEHEASRAVSRGRDRLCYRPAIELWCQGYADDEIARELDLQDGAHAHRVIKAAKQLLKRHFRTESAA